MKFSPSRDTRRCFPMTRGLASAPWAVESPRCAVPCSKHLLAAPPVLSSLWNANEKSPLAVCRLPLGVTCTRTRPISLVQRRGARRRAPRVGLPAARGCTSRLRTGTSPRRLSLLVYMRGKLLVAVGGRVVVPVCARKKVGKKGGYVPPQECVHREHSTSNAAGRFPCCQTSSAGLADARGGLEVCDTVSVVS